MYNNITVAAPMQDSIGYSVGPVGTLLAGFLPGTFFCPSSPLQKGNTLNYDAPGASGIYYPGVMMPTYAGISGSDDYNAVTGTYGTASSGGALYPNSAVSISALQDGTSQVMLLGEQSAYGKDASGNRGDIRSATGFAGFMGVGYVSYPNGPPSSGNANWTTDNRTFNLTTVRYAVNYKTFDTNNANGLVTNGGTNKPIQSAHYGGAYVLMGDGSVKFLNEQMAVQVLKNIANIDDGRAVKDF
jgi:prepilin-type processing-associated H-X9-DG protein